MGRECLRAPEAEARCRSAASWPRLSRPRRAAGARGGPAAAPSAPTPVHGVLRRGGGRSEGARRRQVTGQGARGVDAAGKRQTCALCLLPRSCWSSERRCASHNLNPLYLWSVPPRDVEGLGPAWHLLTFTSDFDHGSMLPHSPASNRGLPAFSAWRPEVARSPSHPCSRTLQITEEWDIVLQGSWNSLQSCKSASYPAHGVGTHGRA